MSATALLQDCEFDSLVESLHSLLGRDDVARVDRWEIRLALGKHGVLPRKAAVEQTLEESLLSTLRSIAQAREARVQAA